MLGTVEKAVRKGVERLRFRLASGRLAHVRKIVYVLTPPAVLRNVGDHAQAVAIRRWFERHHAGLPVLELDKRESDSCLPVLERIVRDEDLIFIHSGGNLGDRSSWSEGVRRRIIQTFPRNEIVSLPQTIFFSDTERGRRERDETSRIYGEHPRLTVIGRDPESGELAESLFPGARTFAVPDFVLSLETTPGGPPSRPPRLLLCLRRDDESTFSEAERQRLAETLPQPVTRFDTTLPSRIPRGRREAVLEETLGLFRDHDVVVTDRYHGLIFSVLCRRPTVVLPTVDHKLTSAMHWFRTVPFIRLAASTEEVPALIEAVLAAPRDGVPDWNAEYFDRLPERLR